MFNARKRFLALATMLFLAGPALAQSGAPDATANYVAAGIGATLAGGGSVAAMENEHGVIIHFGSTTQELRLNAAASGLHFALAQ